MAKTQEGTAPADLSAEIPRALGTQRVALDLPERETAAASSDGEPAAAPAADIHDWRTLTVQSGDSLARMLQERGIDYPVVHGLASAGSAGKRLAQLRPGDELRLGFDPETGTLEQLVYVPSVERQLIFERQGEGPAFIGEIVEQDLERRLQHAQGQIDTSLFAAAAAAELPDRLIMELVDIFRWDIDFIYNIRRGDRFTLVYEAYYRKGERVSTGDIVAAEFINQGRLHRAVRYQRPDGEVGYFAPDGTSMRKAFLRTPVEFTRITSRFGRRRHPISNQIRNHQGVDYAARRGTPIQSTGSGRIVFRGRNGGYGNMVVITHAGRYSTAYAHMSQFASGQRVGSQVEQGETIGYVGSSGYSTGPHLHYEFRVDGTHRNPLAIEFPSVAPVADEHMGDFRQDIAPKVAQLETLHRAYAATE